MATSKRPLWPHGLRCYFGYCTGHGMHAPGLLMGWVWTAPKDADK